MTSDIVQMELTLDLLQAAIDIVENDINTSNCNGLFENDWKDAGLMEYYYRRALLLQKLKAQAA